VGSEAFDVAILPMPATKTITNTGSLEHLKGIQHLLFQGMGPLLGIYPLPNGTQLEIKVILL